MKDQYIPYLQKNCAHLMDSKNEHWDRLDLSSFIARPMKIDHAGLIDKYRQGIFDAVVDMVEADPMLAESFVTDNFSHLGFHFSWQICHLHNLNISTSRMFYQLSALAAHMTENDHDKAQLPGKIWSSNIFFKRGIDSAETPVINPLLLKLILNAKTNDDVTSLRNFFSQHPLSATEAKLLTLVKGFEPRMGGYLPSGQGDVDWMTFLDGLSQLERAGMIDAKIVAEWFKYKADFADSASSIIRAYYDESYAQAALVEVIREMGSIKSLPTSDSAKSFYRESLIKIATLHADGLSDAMDTILKAVFSESGGNKSNENIYAGLFFDMSPLSESLIYASLFSVVNDPVLAIKTIDHINRWVRSSGNAWEPEMNVLEALFCRGEESLYSGFQGQSPQLDRSLGDMICKILRKIPNSDLAAMAFKKMVDDQVVGIEQIKRLIKSKRGSLICQNAALSNEILQQLPAGFRDLKISSDLGL